MIEVNDLIRLISERDEELGADRDDWDSPRRTVHVLFESPQKAIKLFDGSIIKNVDRVRNFKAGYDGSDSGDGWDYSYANGEEIIVEHVLNGESTFFRLTGYDDSWDNGRVDTWLLTKDIVRVQKKTVTTESWVEA